MSTRRGVSRTLARSAIVLVAAVVVAGCGGGTRSAGPVPTVTAEGAASASAAAGSDSATSPYEPYVEPQPVFQLWYHRFHGPGPRGPGPGPVYYVWRTAEELDIPYTRDELGMRPALPVARMAELVLEALVAGPNREEWAFGFENMAGFSPDLVRSVAVEDGVATVDMESAALDPASTEVATSPPVIAAAFRDLAMSQIVFTLTWFPEIEAVRFTTDGQPIAVPVYTHYGQTYLVARPVSRKDYVAAEG